MAIWSEHGPKGKIDRARVAEALLAALAHFKLGAKGQHPWTPQAGIDGLLGLLNEVATPDEQLRMSVELAQVSGTHDNPRWDSLEDDLIYVGGRWMFPNSRTDRWDHAVKIGNQVRRQSGLPDISEEE